MQKSSQFKEAWFNPNSESGNLMIIDRVTGKVQSFKLEEEYVDLRFKYKMTDEDKVKNVKLHGEGYDSEMNPSESYGANGWKPMRRLEAIEDWV